MTGSIEIVIIICHFVFSFVLFCTVLHAPIKSIVNCVLKFEKTSLTITSEKYYLKELETGC